MTQSPVAKAPQPNVVQLSPTIVFGPTKLASDEKTRKLWKQSPNGESFSKGFFPHAARLKRSNTDKRLKERIQVEESFDSHFTRASKKVYGSPKPSREPRQLPLLARKIQKELYAEAGYEVAEPISKLLDRVGSAACLDNFSLGDKVEVRDSGMAEWRTGVVSKTLPLKVTLLDWDEAFTWDFVRQPPDSFAAQSPPRKRVAHPKWLVMEKKNEIEGGASHVASPEMQCTCGNRFQADAIFCSRCGRQRGCEVPGRNSTVVAKPPRPPALPIQRTHRVESQMRRSSSDVVATLHRQQEVDQRFQFPCLSCGGFHARRDCPQLNCSAFRTEAAEAVRHARDLLQTCTSPPLSACSRGSRGSGVELSCDRDLRSWEVNPGLATVRRINHQHQQWQQLTVPILANDGQVIELRRPADTDSQGVWQQNTVPILGENGEVLALRPAGARGALREWRPITLPVFDEQGGIVSLPNGGQREWQPGTVPILTDAGEVIALRPPTSGPCRWKQHDVPIFGETGEVVAVCPSIADLRHWEQLTVPALSENGQAIALRTLGDKLEEPSSNVNAMRNTSTSCGSNRTQLPETLKKRFMKKSSSEPVARRLANPSDGDPSGRNRNGPSTFLTEPELGSSLDVESVLSSSLLSASRTRLGLRDEQGPPDTIVPIVTVAHAQYEDHTFSLADNPCPTNHIANLNLVAMPIASATPTAPVSPLSADSHRTNVSTDSLASIREMIRVANDARQATPEGQMINVLQEALALTPQRTPGTSVSNLLGSIEPEAQELVCRLRQLPDLWRSTILRLLEEAEAAQLTANVNGYR